MTNPFSDYERPYIIGDPMSPDWVPPSLARARGFQSSHLPVGRPYVGLEGISDAAGAWFVAAGVVAFAMCIVGADHHISPFVIGPLPFAALGAAWLIRRRRKSTSPSAAQE